MRLAFIQDWIDTLRGKIPYVENFAYADYLFNNVKEYDTLALGSSHIVASYIPDNTGLNMGTASQDLYYSYEFYKLLNQKNKNIKNIILSFSVFSPGHCLIKTNERKLTVLYKALFGIDYQYPEIALKYKLNKFEKKYRAKVEECTKKIDFGVGYRGGMPQNYFDTTNINPQKAKEIALKHYKNNLRKITQMHILESLINDIENNNQNLIIYVSPCPEEYRCSLPSKEILFKKLYDLCSKHPKVKILNLYDSDIFKKDEFFDEHHLNIKGVRKATEIINNFLKESLVNV